MSDFLMTSICIYRNLLYITVLYVYVYVTSFHIIHCRGQLITIDRENKKVHNCFLMTSICIYRNLLYVTVKFKYSVVQTLLPLGYYNSNIY